MILHGDLLSLSLSSSPKSPVMSEKWENKDLFPAKEIKGYIDQCVLTCTLEKAMQGTDPW